MPVPKIKRQDILKALKFIDKNGFPAKNRSTTYDFVAEDGKRYPPMYVVAVANHLATGTKISTKEFTIDEVKRYMKSLGFSIKKKQQEPLDSALIYQDEDNMENQYIQLEAKQERPVQSFKGYKNPFSSTLIASKNLIFRGAPGTGKSYLAKKIAADIISDGCFDEYTQLTEEQKKQVEFVQFHPSYDYADFVEGLRPKVNNDGTLGFELQDGIFKKFVYRARINYENSQKSKETIEKETSVQESMAEFFSSIEMGVDTFKTINGNEFTITDVDDKHITIYIPANPAINKLVLNLDDVRKLLESGQQFNKVKDITNFFGRMNARQDYSYYFSIIKAIENKEIAVSEVKPKQEELKKYVFIIDEINRGEISKIFGELFFFHRPRLSRPVR